jgi:hypothetical protein
MEDIELKSLWKEYDRKLEEVKILNMQSWALNVQCFETLQSQKAKSILNKLAAFKTWAVIAGVVWVLFLAFLIYHSLTWQKIFFVVSAGAIAIITIIVMVVYLQHIILIRSIDNSENVIDAQQKLAKLQSSTLDIVRIAWLQLPFYTTFFYSPAMILERGPNFWFIGVPVTILFTLASAWLYRAGHYKNSDKKWFNILYGGREWRGVVKASGFLKEIDRFKKESA